MFQLDALNTYFIRNEKCNRDNFDNDFGLWPWNGCPEMRGKKLVLAVLLLFLRIFVNFVTS